MPSIAVSLLPLLAAIAPLALAQTDSDLASSKRGLVYVAPKVATDDNIWDNATSDLTWYYNYQAVPTTAYTNSKLQFVPQLWGAPTEPTTDMTFYNQVKGLIQSGINITWVLGFNEPDGCVSGGSCVPAQAAAEAWVTQMQPLKRDFGVQLGAPAVTGAPTGFTWLQQFFTACAALTANSTNPNGTACEVDFIPVHWYGNFEGLASHIGQVNGTYQNISSIWVTEYAFDNQDLEATQDFYNQSSQYFDRIDYITHYSYFGSFRSDVSNVGPNVAMLSDGGKLTDIGSWYLGRGATGVQPTDTSSSASIVAKFTGWAIAVVAVASWSLL